MSFEILTPPGRIVWGHPLQREVKTDPKTRKAILGKDGKEQDVWAYGLAIPVANFQAVEGAIAQAAYQQYPQGNFPRDFAWKVKRETDLDEQNKPYRDREGYAGHVVITVSTQAFCPPAYKYENGVYRQLTQDEIKCGDWVVAKLSINAHPGGVYINPVLCELVGYDKEIVRRSAVNPTEVLGGRTYALPPGVSMTPISSAPAGVAMPQTAPMAAPVGYAPPMVAPVGYAPPMAAPVGYAAPVAVAPTLPAPAHDFVYNAVQTPVAAPQPQQFQPPAMVGIPQGR